MDEKEPNAFQPGTPDDGEDEYSAEEKARLEATHQVFAEVEDITKHPLVDQNVPEITERLTYLSQKGLSIMAPLKEEGENAASSPLKLIGQMSETDAGPDPALPLRFYPVFPDDAKLGGAAAYYVGQVSYASYGPRSHLIAMNMKAPETPRFLACAFLHELGHAQKAEQEGRAGQKGTRPIEERLQEEIEMWSVESRLMLAIGGQSYQSAVEQFIHEIKKGWDQRRLPQYVGKGVALDACIGYTELVETAGHRDESFNMYCHFMAADKHLTASNAHAYKLQILRDRYMGAYDKRQTALDLL